MRPVYGSEIHKGQLNDNVCFRVALRCGGTLQRGKGQQGELLLCACLVSCSFLYASDIWLPMDGGCWFTWRLDDLAWLFLSPAA